MNREVERRQHKRPMMSDLRECGALEFDADVIIFVNREDGKKEDATDAAELIVGKNRNGPLGDAKVSFVRAFSSFRNIEESPGRRQTAMPLDKPPPAQEPEREDPPPPTERYP
jgi:replicative DNA helicase